MFNFQSYCILQILLVTTLKITDSIVYILKTYLQIFSPIFHSLLILPMLLVCSFKDFLHFSFGQIPKLGSKEKGEEKQIANVWNIRLPLLLSAYKCNPIYFFHRMQVPIFTTSTIQITQNIPTQTSDFEPILKINSKPHFTKSTINPKGKRLSAMG